MEKQYAADGSGEEVVEYELRILSGPALYGMPHTIEDEWGVLVPAIGDAPDVEGDEPVLSSGTAMAYDSIRWELRRGDRDESIAGRDTEHWVLTIDAWGVQSPGGDREMLVRNTGRGDLWFDPSLVFSAVPFAVARNSGFPLGVQDRAAALHVLHQALPELRERGLLLRAELSETGLAHVEGMDQPMEVGPNESTLRVDEVSVETGSEAGPNTAHYLEQYVPLTSTQAADLEMAQRLMGGCAALRSIPEGSSASGTLADRNLAGGAVFAAADSEPLQLAIGTSLEADDLVCVVVAGPTGPPVAGTLEVDVPDLAGLMNGAPANGRAWVTAVGGPTDAPGPGWIFVPESGTVEFAETGDGRLTGSLRLEGWQLAGPTPEGSAEGRLAEGVALDLSFSAARPTPDGM